MDDMELGSGVNLPGGKSSTLVSWDFDLKKLRKWTLLLAVMEVHFELFSKVTSSYIN